MIAVLVPLVHRVPKIQIGLSSTLCGKKNPSIAGHKSNRRWKHRSVTSHMQHKTHGQSIMDLEPKFKIEFCHLISLAVLSGWPTRRYLIFLCISWCGVLHCCKIFVKHPFASVCYLIYSTYPVYLNFRDLTYICLYGSMVDDKE